MVGPWRPVQVALLNSPRRLREATQKSLEEEAEWIKRKMIDGINNQAPGGRRFKGLKAATIQKKARAGMPQPSSALIGWGDMRDAIRVIKRGSAVFVGIPMTARGGGGQLLFMIAQVHEGGSSSKGIPPRPFREPIFDMAKNQAVRRFGSRLGSNLGGFFGRIPPVGDM